MRESFSKRMADIFKQQPILASLDFVSPSGEEDINTSESWFAVVWSLVKQSRYPQADTSDQKLAANLQQIIVIYEFKALEKDGGLKLSVIGAMPLKMEDEDFWVACQPTAGF